MVQCAVDTVLDQNRSVEAGVPPTAPGIAPQSPADPGSPTGVGSQNDTPGPVWGSPEFGAIYAEHAQSIHYLALRFLGDPVAAQDATQDVFLKAWRKFGEFRGDSAVRTWLYRITVNHCQNILQSWHRRHMFSNADDAVWETAAAPEQSPLRILETKELGEVIGQTLSDLPDEYRLLLLLVADEQLSYEDVAQLTGQTADAVRGKLFRARKAFAARFRAHA
jgi:RNA polymerase sigma-70 factor (ECF subfamily)